MSQERNGEVVPAPNLVRCTVRLEKKQWERIKEIARVRAESRSSVIRQAVVRFLEAWRD